ncbi:hypothetical protein FZ934_25495 (plasmid) [Rhizobium grahamii]|uniref:Uncharacterized protein n=1 Tax=Rhizobium grahamii TaxID=1120045 RepID=A0A5Q0CCR6_9HYPH|nr:MULTISPECIES: hypothetical protein [Rhizobium]QFY63596.1 hypothetical protein FZ934_25495 [Rhizobium grahamii]QRM51640.1 hypothetical protein F3Y33_20150 [Rhizobium sp. BG6]
MKLLASLFCHRSPEYRCRLASSNLSSIERFCNFASRSDSENAPAVPGAVTLSSFLSGFVEPFVDDRRIWSRASSTDGLYFQMMISSIFAAFKAVLRSADGLLEMAGGGWVKAKEVAARFPGSHTHVIFVKAVVILIVTTPLALATLKTLIVPIAALPADLLAYFHSGEAHPEATTTDPLSPVSLPIDGLLLKAQKDFDPVQPIDPDVIRGLLRKVDDGPISRSKSTLAVVDNLRTALDISLISHFGLSSSSAKSVPLAFVAGDDQYDKAMAQRLSRVFRETGYSVGEASPTLIVRARLLKVSVIPSGDDGMMVEAKAGIQLTWSWLGRPSIPLSLPDLDLTFEEPGDREHALARLYDEIASQIMQVRPYMDTNVVRHRAG